MYFNHIHPLLPLIFPMMPPSQLQVLSFIVKTIGAAHMFMGGGPSTWVGTIYQ